MKAALPPCPACGTNRQVKPLGVVGDMFHCCRCGGGFDCDPEEGGTHSDWNPAARLERAERKPGRKQQPR